MQPCHVKNEHEHSICTHYGELLTSPTSTRKPQAYLPEMRSQIFQHKQLLFPDFSYVSLKMSSRPLKCFG